MDIAGLAKLIDADLYGGLLNNQLELCEAHHRVNCILGRAQVMHCFEQLGICPAVVDPMLLDGDDRAPFYHLLVRVLKEPVGLILMDKGNNMWKEHIGTRGLVCSLDRVKVLPYVSEGLLGVNRVLSWAVFSVEVVVMRLLFLPLKLHTVDVVLGDQVQAWTKITSNSMEEDETQ